MLWRELSCVSRSFSSLFLSQKRFQINNSKTRPTQTQLEKNSMNNSNHFLANMTAHATSLDDEPQLPSVIICSPRRASKCDLVPYLPPMVVTRLEEDFDQEPLGGTVSEEKTPVSEDQKLNTTDSMDSPKPANTAGMPSHRKRGSSAMQLGQPKRGLRDGIRSTNSLSPVRHCRNRALSEEIFEACIIPNLHPTPPNGIAKIA